MIGLIILTLTLVALTVAAVEYIRRAKRSIEASEQVWKDLFVAARKIVNDPAYPAPVARMVLMMAHAAGCGCFVRGMILAHYLPFVARRSRLRADEFRKTNHMPIAMSSLSTEQRTRVERVLIMTLVYDGFANPLQGWLFRRVVRLTASVTPTVPAPRKEVKEVKDVAFSVAARRQVEKELCPA